MLANCSSNCTFLLSDQELFLLQSMSEVTQDTKDEHAGHERLQVVSGMTRIRKIECIIVLTHASSVA